MFITVKLFFLKSCLHYPNMLYGREVSNSIHNLVAFLLIPSVTMASYIAQMDIGNSKLLLAVVFTDI